MSKRRKPPRPTPRPGGDDPRRPGGGMVGGSPHGQGDTIIDTRNAVLLDHTDVCAVDGANGKPIGFALQLSGRISRTTDRTRILYLMPPDGVASLVSELLAVTSRARSEVMDQVLADLDERITQLRTDGLLTPPPAAPAAPAAVDTAWSPTGHSTRVPANRAHRPFPTYDPTARAHSWVTIATFATQPTRWTKDDTAYLDQENLLDISTGCLHCEHPYTPALATHPCPGEPMP